MQSAERISPGLRRAQREATRARPDLSKSDAVLAYTATASGMGFYERYRKLGDDLGRLEG